MMYVKISRIVQDQSEINDVGAYNRENVKESYRTGFESLISYRLENVNIYVSSTFSKNKINDYTFYFDQYDEDWNYIGQGSTSFKETDLAFSPELIASFGLSYSFGSFESNIESKYVDQQYLDNTSNNQNSIDAYFVSDLNVAYTVDEAFGMFSSLKFYGQINNLFDEEYESNGWVYNYTLGASSFADRAYYPQAGRNFLIGISLEY